MIKAVLDTNVLASGFLRINPGAPPAQLIDAWLAGAFELLTSDVILGELGDTLASPYFVDRLPPLVRGEIQALLQRRATIVHLTVVVAGIATHPEDDLILATALSGGAAYLVTGDARLRGRVPAYQGVQLLSPRAFLDWLSNADDPLRA